MSGIYDYPPRNQYGWGTSSHDYHSHIQKIERTPSVLPDVPHYPNVHRVFNNNSAVCEETREPEHKVHHKNHTPRFQEKVEVIEYERVTEQGRNGDSEVVYEESVDVEAEAFIKQKHKGLELCKWATFKKH